MRNKFIYVFFVAAALLCCFIFSASAGFDTDSLDAESVLEIEKVESLDECFATGDTDDSGSIDSADARFILRVAVNLEKIDTSAFMKADVDGDGEITAADARTALRMAVGLEVIPEHDIEEIVISKPTCHSNGLSVKICKTCMKVYAIYEPSMSEDYHIAGSIEVVLPTCVDKGYYQRKCTVCKEVIIYRESEPTGIHIYGDWTYPEGNSCEKASPMERECTVCGHINKKIDAAGHHYEWIVTQKVSCNVEGIEVYKCKDCGLKGTPSNGGKAEIITKAWKHIFDEDYSVITPATCTEDGVKGRICGLCGEAEEELAIPATGHDWDNAIIETVNAANCCDEGLEKVICPVCREYEERIIPVTEHDVEGEWNVVAEATCTVDGIKTAYCNYCRKNVEVAIPATGHTVEWSNLKPASCTENGIKIGNCSVCGETDITEETDKLPHEFNYSRIVWKNDAENPAPCEGIWEGYYKCKNCDEKEYKEFAQVACSSKQGDSVLTREVSPASCVSPRMVEEYCQYCKKTIGSAKAEGSAIPHNYEGQQWVTTLEPTCTEKGSREKSCAYNCGHAMKEEIAATGHSYGEAVTVLDPTCTAEGKKESVCSVCDDVKTEAIPANGHTKGAYIETTAATCSSKGIEEARCTVCNTLLDTRETEMTAHTPKTVIIADTGELVDNNYVVKCKVVCEVCDATISEESTFDKIFVNSEETLTVEFSELPADLKSGDKVEFTVTGAPENSELLVSVSYLKYYNDILTSDNGTYSFEVPEGLGDADSIIIQIQIVNA